MSFSALLKYMLTGCFFEFSVNFHIGILKMSTKRFIMIVY